jgi:hypothetical protein
VNFILNVFNTSHRAHLWGYRVTTLKYNIIVFNRVTVLISEATVINLQVTSFFLYQIL